MARSQVTQVTAKVMAMESMQDRYALVQQRIKNSSQRAHREGQVRLLAVSKTVAPERVVELIALGQRDFGENYIQEGVDKIQAVARLCPAHQVVWHCIGPIQSNKTKLVAQHFDWVHSIDRLKIAQRLSEQRSADQEDLQVCIQVNIDEQPTKSGVTAQEALALATAIASLPKLRLRGLMTIPEPLESFEQQLRIHRRAKQLFDELAEQLNLPYFDTLSMGMTADLEAAIEAGSTMVRVGTAIFGGRI
jgi:PLP dependent protein